jgi:WD40 repeat protein/predicted Ser/Thr protein kinase
MSNFGRYQIIRELGRGGMGVVYQCYDPQIKRYVALKIINEAITNEELRRFEREAHVMAKLNHPHIIKLFDIGEDQGRYFITMELVEGQSLAQLFNESISLPHFTQILVKVAGAVYYAHQRGVIHRDLKPSNIMVGRDGEPRVMDFGLAKDVGGTAEAQVKNSANEPLSKNLQVIGTPEYMAPEQACGQAKKIDARSDIYALGMILYRLLAGRLPFSTHNTINIIYQIIFQEPNPPSHYDRTIPRDLEAICLKAIEKEKARRYQNALALAEDLQRYLNGKPVLAQPVTAWVRGLKWIHRHRVVSLLSVGTILLLIGFVVFFVYQQKQLAEQQRKLAKKESTLRQEAERQKAAAVMREIKANLSQAKAELILAKTCLNEKDYFSAEERQIAAYALLQQVNSSLKENAWYQENRQELGTLGLQQQALEQAALAMRRYVIGYFLPRYEQMEFPLPPLIPSQPSFDYAALLDKQGQKVVIWDIRQQKDSKIFNIVSGISGIAFSANNQYVAIGDMAGNILLWNRVSDSVQALKANLNCGSVILRFSPDNKWLFANIGGTEEGSLLFDLTNLPAPLKLHDVKNAFTAAFSQNGEWLAVARHENSVAVFDLRQSKDKLVAPAYNKEFLTAEQLCFGPQDTTLISGYMNDIWVRPFGQETEDRTREDKFTLMAAHRGGFMNLALSSDGQFFFSAGEDSRLVCWNTFNYNKIWELHGHLRWKASIIAHPEQKQAMVWTAGAASRYTWETPVYKKINFAERPETRKMAVSFRNFLRSHVARNMASVLSQLAFSHDNQYIAVYAYPYVFLCHLLEDTLLQLNTPGNLRYVGEERELAFDGKNEYLLLALRGAAYLLQTSDGKPKLPIRMQHQRQQFWLRPQGGLLSIREGEARLNAAVWQIVGESLILEKEFAISSYSIIALHPAGKQIALVRLSQSALEIWDIQTARQTATVSLGPSHYIAVTFLSDTRIALGCENGDLLVCDLQERQNEQKVTFISSFFAPIRRIWHQADAHLYWVYTSNGLYIYPDTHDASLLGTLNQIYPLQMFSGYSVTACDISKDFRYLAMLMLSGELLVVPLPEVKR